MLANEARRGAARGAVVVEETVESNEVRLSGKRVKVRFHRPHGVTDDSFSPAWNGIAIQVKYEEEVNLPVEYLAVIDDAVIDETMDGGMTRRTKRFSYERI